jgi:DNA-binding winged helix-turn-helix (wHTH) protein
MIYKIENVVYDSENNILKNKGKSYNITKTQKKLLDFLIANPNKVFSKQSLIDNVWQRVVTENTVDQAISTLRSYLTTESNKKIIITHYGQGISFVATIETTDNPEISSVEPNKSAHTKLPLIAVLTALALFFIIWSTYSYFSKPNEKVIIVNEGSKIVFLPIGFNDKSLSTLEQKGASSFLKSSFNILDSEGTTIFDEASKTTQQAIEKHWRLDKNLVVIHSNITKKDNIYQAELEFSNGIETLNKMTLTSSSLNDLLQNQIREVSHYNSKLDKSVKLNLQENKSSPLLLKALGYKDSSNYRKAEELLKKILDEDEYDYHARLELVDVLTRNKKFKEAESHLDTLKTTDIYNKIAVDVELYQAQIALSENKFKKVTQNLINFSSTHLSISQAKKSEIQLLLGQAYYSLGETSKALQAYNFAINEIDERRYPLIYAKSYFLQAQLKQMATIDDSVYDLYDKARSYANIANDLGIQISALNGMSIIYYSRQDFEKAIALTKQALQLARLDNNDAEIAKGLGTLIGIFNQQGYFSKAVEVNNKLKELADKTKSDTYQLYYLHYSITLSMNTFDWSYCKQQLDKQKELAVRTNNIGMQLDNSFLDLELRLLKKNTEEFKQQWDKSVSVIKKDGFDRYLIYMDFYLARYYKQIGKNQNALELFKKVANEAKKREDNKTVVLAQNYVADIISESDPKAALKLLNSLGKFNPPPNPYLETKAKVLNKLEKNIQALTLLNQAKRAYHESWTAENESFLQSLLKQVDGS